MCLSFLENNPSSYRMFEQLVLRNEILTVEDFFHSVLGVKQRLEMLHLEPEIVDRLVGFREFEKIRFEDRDVVLFAGQDRDALLDSFSELREMYDRNLFGVFADRFEEEVAFWDGFMKKLKDEQCYLYGNSLDGKLLCTKEPTFMKTKWNLDTETTPFEFDFQDVEMNNKNETYVKVGNQDALWLIQKINSQSATILHRGIDHEIKDNQATNTKLNVDFSEFEIPNPVKSTDKKPYHQIESETALKSQSVQKRSSLIPEVSLSNDQFVSEFKRQAILIQKSLQQRIATGFLGQFFGTEDSGKIIRAINGNRSENLNLHDPKNVYVDSECDKNFEEKYKEFNELACRLLRKAFSVYPINNEIDWKLREKVVIELKALFQKLEIFKNDVGKNGREDETIRQQAPLMFLMTTLSRAIGKLTTK